MQALTSMIQTNRAVAEIRPGIFYVDLDRVTEADWTKWNIEALRPYLDVAFEAFGTDRLMFGSDWPVCLLAASYMQVKEVIEDYTRDLSANEREKIFGLNAARFYGLAAQG